MEKFKSLLSFALSVCLTSTTFKVLGNSLNTEMHSKALAAVAPNAAPPVSPAIPVSLAMSDATAQATTPVSTVISEAPTQSTEDAEAKKNWNTAVSTYQQKADEAEKNGNTAISAYKAEIAKNPNRPDLWKKIADIENKLQRHQNAIEALKNAIKLQPPNAELYASLSETYTLTNQPKEALVAVKEALRIDPKNIDYLNRSVLLANWAEDYTQAEDSYKRILTIQPNNRMARVGLENTEAKIANAKSTTQLNTNTSVTGATTPVSIAISEETAKLSTPVSIAMSEETAKAKAAETAEAIKNDLAISAYKEEISNDPNRPDLWQKIADIEKKQQHYQNAINALKNAIKIQPQNAELYVSLSETYALANQSKESLIAINQAIQIDPKNIEYLNRRGILAIWAEEYDQAADSYNHILNIEPNNQIARVELNIAVKMAKSKSITHLNANTSTAREANPPVSENAPVSLGVAPKRKPLTTTASVTTPKRNNVLSPPTNPADRTGAGYIEGGFECDHLSAGNGHWNNQYIKSSLQTDPKNTLAAAIEHDFEFGEKAFYGEIGNTHIINDKWFSNVTLGLSDNSIFVPKYFFGTTISRKLLKEENLVAYLGGHAYWWRPSPITTQDLNPGLIYYFESPWILEGGVLFSRFMPGAIFSKSYYISVTQGKEKDHLYTLRYNFGRAAYQTIDTATPALTNYSSTDITATWRQWIDKYWGFNITAEAYRNRFYERYGITVGLFRDFL